MKKNDGTNTGRRIHVLGLIARGKSLRTREKLIGSFEDDPYGYEVAIALKKILEEISPNFPEYFILDLRNYENESDAFKIALVFYNAVQITRKKIIEKKEGGTR